MAETSINCEWESLTKGSPCVRCGYRLKRHYHRPPAIVCEARPIMPPRLGDYTERLLKSVGVTEDRYKAAKELFGLAPTCGCEARKLYLNKISDWWRGQG